MIILQIACPDLCLYVLDFQHECVGFTGGIIKSQTQTKYFKNYVKFPGTSFSFLEIKNSSIKLVLHVNAWKIYEMFYMWHKNV